MARGKMETMKAEIVLYLLSLFWTFAFSFEFNSFGELRTALMNDKSHEYVSLPYQEEDKYTESGAAIKVIARVIIADEVTSSTKDTLDVTLHLQAVWKDTRLSFNATSPNNNYTLAPSIQNKIWTPATYLEPEWGSQNEDTRVIRVFPNGVLAESKRVQAKIPCEMKHFGLKHYQLECASILTSYTHGIDEVNLNWDEKEPIVLNQARLAEGRGVTNNVVHDVCSWRAFQNLQSPCLQMKLHVTISFPDVFYRMYIPSFMSVMMAWSSFWIHRDECSARVKLGTLVVWTMVTEFVHIGFTYPDYVRAPVGNVWMTGCLSFTWLSFFLYIIVHVVRRRELARAKQELAIEVKKEKEEKKTGERTFSITSVHPDGTAASKMVGYSVWEHKAVTKWRLHLTSFQVDRLCRLWFGIAFAAFNVGFWVYFNVGIYA